MKEIDFLVIGSNSFAGSSFVNHLNLINHKVYCVSRRKELNRVFLPYKWNKKNFKNIFAKIDINKNLNNLIKIIEQIKPKYIINFASQGMVAQSWIDPNDWYQTNLIGQVSFFEKLKKFKFIKKYIHFTTPEVYGSTTTNISENFNFSPSTPYAVSRAACDLHLMNMFKAYKFPVIFTRAANIYGPGQQLYRIIPKTILCCKLNRKIILDGGGKSTRSFIYMDDVSKALEKIIFKGKIGSTYHISTNKLYSIKDLVKTICNINKRSFKQIVSIGNERLGKDENYSLSSKKLKNDLKWKPAHNLEKGLLFTTKWIEEEINILKKLPHKYIHIK
tara:strand:- start:6622 stop:7617 length:996 start_codon:yes stop_codon:yes gene_type:complete